MIGIYAAPASIAAFIATGMISLAPNILLLVMPQYTTKSGDALEWLVIGQAAGAGGLLADVFLHTLPESANYESTGICVLIGFVFFFVVDLIVRSLNENQNKDHEKHTPEDKTTEIPIPHGNSIKRSVIVLNLVADALHNFTDGLAIGASYAISDKPLTMASTATVWSTLTSHYRGGFAAVSICFHEIPHEISDFCTLVRAGYSTKQAILAQLVTAVAAFVGTAIAISVSAESWIEDRLLCMTAGGFLYLAGTTILPDVLKENGNGVCKTVAGRFMFRLAQCLAFCSGIVFLGVVDWLSGDDDHNHHFRDHKHTHHQKQVTITQSFYNEHEEL